MGVYMDDRMSGHAFAKNPWLVRKEVAFCYADIRVASDETGKR